MRVDINRWLFAGVTRRAAFGENFFSAGHRGGICGDVGLSTGSIGEMKWLKPTEKGGDICQTLFGRAPENGMLPRVENFEGFLRRESDQAIVPCQPILREHADVDVNTDRRTGHAD